MNSPNIISLERAVLCLSCSSISDSRGEVCAACGASGSLMSLARVLAPTPELGRINYIFAEGEA